MTRARWLGAAAAVVAAVIVVIAVIVLRDQPAPESPAELATPVERPPRPGSAVTGGGALGEAERDLADRRFAEARPLLEQAYAQDPQPATLLKLAGVELALGRCREAKRATQRVLAANVAELAEPARQLLARIGHCD